jgi:hypothetical protein
MLGALSVSRTVPVESEYNQTGLPAEREMLLARVSVLVW